MIKKTFLFFKLLYVLTILPVCLLDAQQTSEIKVSQFSVNNWQIEQGLPVNSILSIAQTADGWVYFGTEEGLVRFDGKVFFLMNKSVIPDLNVNFINTLSGARDTSLWIGTDGDGLIRYKNNTFIKYNNSNGLSNNYISALCEDSAGGLWIGTTGGGMNYLKNGMITAFDTSNGLANNFIRSIVIDAKGSIYAGTKSGLSVIENGNVKNYTVKDGLSGDFIESLALDKDQTLWIGTKSGGLTALKKGRFEVYNMSGGLTNNAVMALHFDLKGILWIGTNGGGISLMLGGKFYPFTTKDGLSSNLIVTLLEDKEGNIWAGTSGSGIDMIKKKTIQTLSVKDGLSGDVILPIFEDRSGVLWLGSAGKGLNRYENGRVQTYSSKDGLPDPLILTICEDLEDNIWIGTAGGGLTGFRNGKFQTYTNKNGLSGEVVTAVYCDKSGNLWAGTNEGGLNCFKEGKFTALTTKEGLSHDNITCILEDSKGSLWVGTNGGGLNVIKDNKITIINRKSGLSDDYILSMYEDKQGNLWAGTASNGLNLIRDGKINQFTVKDGLPHEVVLQILEDDFGNFWISCNKGIYQIKKQDLLDFADSKLNSLTTVSYGKSDGMKTTECNGGVFPAGCRTRDGKLMFPTVKGVSIIDPNTVKTVSSYFSPVMMEEFLVDGQIVKTSSNLSIPSDANRLEFRYAALNYSNPGKIKYRCMLIGYDKDWIEYDTRRNAYYTNIPSGDYVFMVMATNESGQWDKQSYSKLKFNLEPPFYRTLTFYLIVFTFLLTLLFFVIYYIIGRYQRRRLKALVDEQTKELQQKMIAQKQSQEELQTINKELLSAKNQAQESDKLKTAFMNNISHEIRTPLNGILGFAQLISDPDTSNEKREKYFEVMNKSGFRLISTITNIMDISLIVSGGMEVNKKTFDINQLLEEIYQSWVDQCADKNISLYLQIPSEKNFFPAQKSSSDTAKLQIHTDTELFTKTLFHLLDNAVKFTEEGTITFGYTANDNLLRFFVKDTGVGIGSEAHLRIFENFMQENILMTRGHEGSGLGLSIAKGIVELLGGEIDFESVKGQGSTFFFTLPVLMTSSHESDIKSHGADIKSHESALLQPVILVAEDDETSYQLIEALLKNTSVRLLHAYTGKTAVQLVREHDEISLVLMDIRMPVMNGLEAAKLIKSYRKDLPIIAVTAHAETGAEHRALTAGCDDYIAKPFDRELLIKKLQNFLGNT